MHRASWSWAGQVGQLHTVSHRTQADSFHRQEHGQRRHDKADDALALEDVT